MLFTLPGSPPRFALGLAVAGGGRIDADAIDDLVVCGSVARVYSGATGALIREHAWGSRQAYSAAILGDVDGHGQGDYAIGWFDFSDVNDSGGVRMYRGGSGGQIWRDVWGIGGAEYGFEVLGPGDLDGDGVPDVVAGAIEDGSYLVQGRGRVRALSGLDGALLFQSAQGPGRAGRGAAMAALGDLDGNGVPEFAVSQPGIGTCCVFEGEPVLVFSGTSGQVVMEIAPDGSGDRFGSGLAAGDVNGDGLTDLLVGARWDDDGGVDSGSVEVLSLILASTAYCQSQTNSLGCTPLIRSSGTPSLAGGGFTVDAGDVINGKNGLLFWGSRPKQSPFLGGWLCVAAPTQRTPLQNSGGNPPPDDCSGGFSFAWTTAYFASKGVAVGDDVYCQYWSRDPQSPSTTSLTGGLAFTVEP